jgi:hypothetical protein
MTFRAAGYACVLAASVVAIAGCTRHLGAAYSRFEATVSEGEGTSLTPLPKTFTLRPGTPLNVQFDADLSARSAQAGSAFRRTLLETAVAESAAVALAGSKLYGLIVDSQRGARGALPG